MSNTRRPSTARKVTRSSEETRKAALEDGFQLNVKGETYAVRVGDVSNKIVAEMRKECGSTPMALFLQMREGFIDLDQAAHFVWLACRLRGETIALDQIDITYDDMFSEDFMTELEDGAVGVDPEA